MPRLIKLTLLSGLLLFTIVSSTAAAFPLENQTVFPVEKSTSSKIAGARMAVTGKAQLRKELRKIKKESKKTPFGGGGKNKLAAALLALFLGSYGVHSFYMGQNKKGIIQLALGLIGTGLYIAGIVSVGISAGVALPTLAIIGSVILLGVSIWALVDFVRILTGGLEPEEGFDS